MPEHTHTYIHTHLHRQIHVGTTVNSYTIAALLHVQSLHTNLFSLSAIVFTGL
jgi:hypothetical protein